MMNSSAARSTPGEPNGRDARGRFVVGNRCAKGNPLGAHAQKLRAALFHATSEDDIRAIAERLIEQARRGDLRAIDSLLDRLLGKACPADLQERVERLEAALAEKGIPT